PDHQPGGQGGEQRLGHHQRDHDVQRLTQEVLDELQPSDRRGGPEGIGQKKGGHGVCSLCCAAGPRMCSRSALILHTTWLVSSALQPTTGENFGWSFRGAPKLSERASPKSVIPWSPARLGPGMTAWQ